MKTQNNQQNQQNMQSKHNQNNQNNSHAQHNEDGVLRLDGDETRPGDPTQELLNALGTTISPDLLVEALTHRSFSHEHPGTRNYERLEFLGDAVLE
ncbi:ribonuclease III, partial [Bifidobacteriaceae bacterium NR015]